MPLDLASRFARRWLFNWNRVGGRKSVLKGLIERLFLAVAFSLLAIGMILIRFALRLGNYFGSPSSRRAGPRDFRRLVTRFSVGSPVSTRTAQTRRSSFRVLEKTWRNLKMGGERRVQVI